MSKEGTPRDLLLAVVAPPVDGSGRKTTTLVGDHEYFIPTKFHQNPFSRSGEEVENVKSLRRTPDDGRTDGRRTVRYDNSSLELRSGELKTTILVGDHDYFIPTKFNENLFSGSGEEVEYV